MGTPEFGAMVLDQLILDHNVVAVFTSPPRPCGRGQKLQKTPVHILAEKNNLDVFTPGSLKKSDTYELIESICADIIVVCAYGFLIPKNILESKKFGCINLHPSKLPRWRGASPLQHTIISGDIYSAVCVMQMDEGLDTGPILKQHDFQMPQRATLRWLHDYTAKIGSKMISEVVGTIENLEPIPQSNEGVSYAGKLTRDDALVDWNMSAELIDCKIRGQNPWPGSIMNTNLGQVKILEAETINIQESVTPGKILGDKDIIISCGSNTAIKILKLQIPGKKIMEAHDFLNGYNISELNIL
ncbi:MAG: methionyl-tRNA formyltransferase [Rickettsiaceae bacterium]|nr:methionyl-tRNA formyltransferase [Rickettsiaceae bacterium]